MSKENKNISTVDINTDDREPYDWKTKYPKEARKEMFFEALYIFIMLFISAALLILNYLGVFSSILGLEGNSVIKFEYILYFTAAGLLGGIVFGMKYFYRVVARGFWTQDRRYWRILSPFISMIIAFIVGSMVSAGILSSDNNASNAWATAFGFFAGYFADEAVGKMYEIATLLFGKKTDK